MKISVIVLIFFFFLIFCIEKRNKNEYVFTKDSTNKIKGILAIFIILHHLSHRISTSEVLSQFGCIGYIVVALFFMFSGYGLMKQYTKNKEKYTKNFLRKRIPTLLIPFIITSCILFVEYNLLGRAVTFQEFLLSFVNLKPLDGTCWYVYVILLMYIVFYISVRLSKGEKGVIIKTSMITIIFFILGSFYDINYWWYLSVLAFPVGMIYAFYDVKITKYINKKYFRWLVFSALGFLCFYKYLAFSGVYYTNTIKGLVLEQIPIILFILFIIAINIRYSFNSKILEFLGGISYELYISQTIVFTLLTEFVPIDVLGFSGYFILTFIIIIPLATLLNKLNKLVLTRIIKVY